MPSISAYVGGYGADGVAITSWPSVHAPTVLPKSRKLLDVSSPTFVRSHPKLPVIYVTSEMGADRRNLRSVTAAGVVLSVVNSGGTAPVRSDVNAVGDRLAVANYDGSVALFALTRNGAIGNRLALVSLGNGSGTQGAAVTTGSSGEPDGARLSHPHSVTFNPSGTELWVADIGTDLVMRFDLGPEAFDSRGSGTVAHDPRFGAVSGRFRLGRGYVCRGQNSTVISMFLLGRRRRRGSSDALLSTCGPHRRTDAAPLRSMADCVESWHGPVHRVSRAR